MSYFNMVCDSCGREVQGITWVNGMKFCAKCYQEIFGNKNMTENLKNMYEAYLKSLNEKDQQIAELEEQLKNSIRPKFKIGDKVYAIIDTWAYTDVFPVEIRDTQLLYEVWDGEDTTKQHSTRIFATKEEAQAKLRELGETKNAETKNL